MGVTFSYFSKERKGKRENRADAMDEMVERRYRGNGWAMRMELVIFFRSLELRSNNLLLQGDA